jgi:hypothetical protein
MTIHTIATRAARGALAVAAALLLIGAAPSLAAPPANDDYLGSIRMVDATGHIPVDRVQDTRDTTDATVQTDLFGPASSGGGVEATTAPAACGGAPYGKTVWYDFAPPKDGAVELQASGYANVIALYEFSKATSALGPMVTCSAPGGSTDVIAKVRAGRSYTAQIGGVDAGAGPAGGLLTFGFEYFPDADGDGVFDVLDKCPTFSGVDRFGGCPATVNAHAFVTVISSDGQLYINRIRATGPSGTRVDVRCRRHCTGHWHATVPRGGSIVLPRARHVHVVKGSVFEVRLTKAGLFGRFQRYTVRNDGFDTAVRCLAPVKDPEPERCTGSDGTSG